MPPQPQRRHAPRRWWRLSWLTRLLPLVIMVLALAAAPRWAEALQAPAAESRYQCDGDLLVARHDNGAVDAIGIPNSVAGTVPGSFVVIDWRGQHLQLPRTNQAGAPSYTDGRWWWSLEDPLRPCFREVRASETRFDCLPETRAGADPQPSDD